MAEVIQAFEGVFRSLRQLARIIHLVPVRARRGRRVVHNLPWVSAVSLFQSGVAISLWERGRFQCAG